MSEKSNARSFRKKHQIKTINSGNLIKALGEQGYTVIEFNGIDDSDDVNSLIDALDLQEYISSCRCFSYQSDKYRLVFLNEKLSEEERTVVLAHEEGHIWNGHMTKGNVLGEDVLQEFQANEFAHHLLKKPGKRKRLLIAALIAVMVIAVLGAGGWYAKQQHDKSVYMEDLYITDTGSKYHLRGCMYIKDKTDVHRLTQEDFEAGKYEPCGVCMPDKR